MNDRERADKAMLDNIKFDSIPWTEDIDLIPLGKGAILIDRANPGTFYVDGDAEGSVEMKLVPTQKGYKTVTFTLAVNHGKVFAENCIGGEVHQDGDSFKVEHERFLTAIAPIVKK